MLDDEVAFRSCLGETIRVQVRSARFGAPTHEQWERARVASREIRRGVECRDRPVVVGALRLYQALFALDSAYPYLELEDSAHAPEFLHRVVARLEEAFEFGRLVVTEGAIPLLGIPPEVELVLRPKLELPEIPSPPPRKESAQTLTFFEVRYVDEIGQAIGGLEVEFKAGSRVETVTTNPAGVATLEEVVGTSASVGVLDLEALGKILDPRWEKPRPGAAPAGVNTHVFSIASSGLSGVALKAAVPNTVVITPPRGKLFVELWDKFGRVRHANQKYSITGPQSFSGTTDAEGRLLHEEVVGGSYKLELTVEVDTGDGKKVSDKYETTLVVLNSNTGAPQLRMLGVLPRVAMARLRDLLFDTHKSFLLPGAIESLKTIRQIYQQNAPCKLLIVGHTDTTGDPEKNDPLSKERADSVKAYLEDDVDAWLANYDLEGEKRWAGREDRAMIGALPDADERGEGEDPVTWFQRTRELSVDGKAGPETRRQLITEYMALDGIELSEEPDLEVSIETHGAGENFPLAGTGFELDTQAADGKADARDRRVELFFFDAEFGIVPPPGAPDGDEYLKWRERAFKDQDFPVAGLEREVFVVEVEDGMFRTDSAVVLPEAEAPSADAHESLTAASVFATALAFARDNPTKELLVAGHTDTAGAESHNQPLSEERAECALLVLEGTAGEANRGRFGELCDGRNLVSDQKQVLSWAARQFGFNCDPGTIDDNEFTGIEPIKGFQRDYNQNRARLGVPDAAELEVDGSMGKNTWSAVFDCYEAALALELSSQEKPEDRLKDLAAIREGLKFVDDEKRSLGFGEHHTIDKVGQDSVRSQANRRVELLFFNPQEDLDLEQPPKESEIYLPGNFKRTSIPPTTSGQQPVLVGEIHMQLFDDAELAPLASKKFTITGDGTTRSGTTDSNGVLREKHVPIGDYELKIEGREQTAVALVLIETIEEPQIRFLG